MPRAAWPGWVVSRREYPDFDAAEWQVRLHAPDQTNSGLFTEVESADFVARFPKGTVAVLHWNKGSHDEPSDFAPCEQALATGRPLVLESFGGRASDGVMPYFNLAGKAGGLVLAVGWSGDWRARFEDLGEAKVRITAGLKHARFQLRAVKQRACHPCSR